MSKKTFRGIGLALLALAGAGVAATMALAGSRNDATGPRATVRVERGSLREAASVSGTIEPHTQVDIYSRTSGEVMEVLVEEGSVVQQGDVLFRLDPIDADRSLRLAESDVLRYRSALAEANAQLAASELSLRHATETARLGQRGVELGLTAPDTARVSDRDRDLAQREVALRRAQLASARAQVKAAQLAVEDARRTLERTEIKAPFAGTVLSVGVERGAIVASPMGNVSGGTTLVTLADLSDLRVIGDLDEAQIGRVKVGQDVTFHVDAYPNRSFGGEVQRVSPLGEVDTNVVVFDVEIVVTDPHADLLRSGMSADVEIVTGEERDALLVPLMAIRSQGELRQVELPDGTRRTLRTGASDGEHIVVLAGLSEGDEIVADGRLPVAESSEPERRSGLLPGPPRKRR